MILIGTEGCILKGNWAKAMALFLEKTQMA